MSSDTEIVRAARDRYLVASGYGVDSYTDPRFKISIGRFSFSLRNPGKVHFHDLHHVVSGYSTGLVGEGEVSAYELRGGCHSYLIAFLCVGAVAIGSILSPRRILTAWRRAEGTSTLYSCPIDYEKLLEMRVEDLRRMVKIPAEGFR